MIGRNMSSVWKPEEIRETYLSTLLILGKGPALYGTTYDGGDTTCSMQGYNNCGIAFKISF